MRGKKVIIFISLLILITIVFVTCRRIYPGSINLSGCWVPTYTKPSAGQLKQLNFILTAHKTYKAGGVVLEILENNEVQINVNNVKCKGKYNSGVSTSAIPTPPPTAFIEFKDCSTISKLQKCK